MTWTLRSRLWTGTFVLFGARLLLSLIRTGPVLVADEIGYLTNARVIAGGIPGQLEQAPFYRGGYSLLIAPLIELGSSPAFIYHLVLALNAALAASVLPLLYFLLTRFGGVRGELAFWAALAGAAYPALTVLSQVAMSENALFPLVVVWLIAFGGLLSVQRGGREVAWAAGLGATTGALWSVHNRMVVAILLALAGLIWLPAAKRIRPAAAAVGIGAIALAFLGVHFLDSYLIDHNYAGSAPGELSERMDDLLRFAGLRTALANLIGQSWYLLVATFGLAAAAAWDFLRSRRGDGEERPAPALGVLLALSALLLLISASAFPERTRPDMLIYGRYTEIVAPALIAFGLAALPRVRGWIWPLAGFGALTALVLVIRATASDPDAANRWNISALPFITVQLGPGILLGAALVAAVGAGLLLWSRGHRRLAPALVAIALFVPVTAYGAWNPVRSSQRAVYPAGWESPEAVVAGTDAKTIAYDLDHYDTIGLYTIQWFLPKTELTLFHGNRQPPSSRLVLSGEAWADRHPRAEALWSWPGRDQVLWEAPGPGAR